MDLRETIHGKGLLRASHGASERRPVEYRLDVVTQLVEAPGLPPLAGNMSGRGQIRASDGAPIPEGVYELESENGELLRVRKHGLGWVVVSS